MKIIVILQMDEHKLAIILISIGIIAFIGGFIFKDKIQ